jgi:hypothetical protein
MIKAQTNMKTLTFNKTKYFIGGGGWLFSIACLLLFMALVVPVSAQASVSAHVDRDTINEGDTFTLNLTVSGSNDSQPDLSVLHKDFDVIGTGQRSEIQIINGSIESHHAWSITLSPHHTGKLVIPAISVGNESSAALAVTVLPATASINNGADKGDVFIEVNTKPDHVYVQAQLLYTVRLYYAVPLRQGTLSEPSLDNAIVQKLGSDSNFETQRNGRRYQVIERRYAIFPQQTGDPFFDRFNPATRHVRLRSRQLDIQVAKQPANFQGSNWLPAQDIQLEQKWSPAQPQFRVGEPVTRTVIIRAKGLSASQLPDLPLPNQTGLKLYPDQAQTSSTPSGDTLVSKREQKIAMIPTQTGDLTLPAIQLNWWDTQSKRQRTALLPAQTIHVLPGLAADSGTTITTPANAPTTVAQTTPKQMGTTPAIIAKSSVVPGTSRRSVAATVWIALAVFFAVAWLITLLLWWRVKRPRPQAVSVRANTDDISKQATIKRVSQACEQNDQQALKRALLDWARLHWSGNPPLSLGALAARVEDAQLTKEIASLDKVLYQANVADWSANQLLQYFLRYLKQSNNREQPTKPDVLEPLHLNKTRVAGR